MVKLIKHEWHQVDSQFSVNIDEDLLSEIYSDLDEEEISILMLEILTGTKDIKSLMDDAYAQGVDIEWERQHDDWWTERKGGYEVTYELGDLKKLK
jgi:hypothetical protein